ncbi:heparan-alpha-glucosaminide N-acetyltransferase-like [Asterias rubens]|uniref:heparan-alpha-glucosaminide N-acetyltransferase-like n=1 Tax=Asterias rubens TaxID=7604 RepID=UPI0014550D0E|nr:heparan-alpha-glucosaminide N-acetyltransferase-like [Asterias rubens]
MSLSPSVSLSTLLFLSVLFNAVHAVDSPSGEVLGFKEGTKSYVPAPSASSGDASPSSLHSTWDAFHFHNARVDTASLYVTNNMPNDVKLWMQSDECYKCKMIDMGDVTGNTSKLLLMDTWWGVTLAVTHTNVVSFNKSAALCNPEKYPYHFGENGNYSFFINLNKTAESDMDVCFMIINKQPDNAYTPIYVAIGVYAFLAVVYGILNYAYMSGAFSSVSNWCATERVVNNDLGAPPSRQPVTNQPNFNNERKRPKRLKSLDTFRGIAIVIMIFVNHGGGSYWFFKHARWNGLTVADLVFPWFVFIMGTSMALSFSGLIRHNVSRASIVKKIIRRTVILFALGIMLDGGMELKTFRVPGVLQRFAVSYFVVAMLHLISAKPTLEEYRISNKYHQMFRDLVDYWYEWLFMISLMILYVCLVFFLPVPGCPTGYFGPGGPLVGENGELTNCTGGATGYIDRWILGENHLYSHPTCQKVYHTTLNYDPEGILGSIPSIFITFLGLQAGKILLLHQFHGSRIKRLLLWSLITGGPAILLCEASKEDGWIPVSKNLWSLSFVLALAGTSFLLLTFCYIVIDMKQWWSGVPFFFAGMNPITLYCGHEILMGQFPFSWSPVYGTHAELLSMSLLCSSLWVCIAYYMFKINFFVKI